MAYRDGTTMTVRRSQKERVDESARRLIAAAIKLINEKGYLRTTAKDIGLQAGYSRAMVAERFGSKEGLLEELLREYEGRLINETDPLSTGFERAMAPVAGICRLAHEDPEFVRAVFIIEFEAMHDAGALNQRTRQWLSRVLGALREGIDLGVADGSVTATVDSEDLSRDVLTSGIGYAYWSIMMPENFDLAVNFVRWRDSIAATLRSPDSDDSPRSLFGQRR